MVIKALRNAQIIYRSFTESFTPEQTSRHATLKSTTNTRGLIRFISETRQYHPNVRDGRDAVSVGSKSAGNVEATLIGDASRPLGEESGRPRPPLVAFTGLEYHPKPPDRLGRIGGRSESARTGKTGAITANSRRRACIKSASRCEGRWGRLGGLS